MSYNWLHTPDCKVLNEVYVAGDGYKVVKQQRESHERQEIAKIPLSQFPAPSWIHDFPITKNYVVVPETPIYFNMLVRGLCFCVLYRHRLELAGDTDRHY